VNLFLELKNDPLGIAPKINNKLFGDIEAIARLIFDCHCRHKIIPRKVKAGVVFPKPSRGTRRCDGRNELVTEVS
jgi:hypothetical protein